MSQPLFIAFLAFTAVMWFTPGPNNIMLLSKRPAVLPEIA